MSNELYAQTFDQYIGQKDAVRLLQSATESAKLRGAPLGHILISSPEAGIGKTALAHLISRTVGSKMECAMGPLDATKAGKIIHAMRNGDILLIDEFHLMRKQDWLLLYMQDGMLTARSGRLEKAPRVTIIGATTNPEALDATIVSRFQMHVKLKPYGQDDAMQIAEQMAAGLFGGMKPWGYELCNLVHAANYNPRVIKQLLTTVRDLALTDNLKWADGAGWDATEAMRLLGIHHDGLTDLHLQYLDILANLGGTAGLDTIVGMIGQKAALPAVEKLLLDRDYLSRDAGGRSITGPGRGRLEELEEDLEERGLTKSWEPDRPVRLAS